MRKYLLTVFLVVSFSSVYSKEAAQKSPQVYSHRGVRAFAPENTMPGYKAALRIGTDFIDMDVVLTKDGEVLVSHDPVLNPDIVRDANGKFLVKNKETLKKLSQKELAEYISKYTVKNLTMAELAKFDVGRLNPDSAYSKYFPDQKPVDDTKMPTLRDVIRYANKTTKNKVGFQIEMKTDPTHPEFSADPTLFAKALYKVLKEEKVFARSEIQSFDFVCLYELQKLDKRIKTAYLTCRDNEKGGSDDFFSNDPKIATTWTGGKFVKDFGNSIPQMVKTLGGFAWEPEDAELTQETLAEAHKLGLKVVVWSWPELLGTAFDVKLTEKMIDWGVDGIITDDPGKLISILAARGLKLPPSYKAE